MLMSQSIVLITLYNWLNFGLLTIEIGFLFDPLVSVMLIIITFISFFVHIYSIGYMNLDPYLPRFISFLSLFTFFMIILVTANNYLQLFFGWEGVGVCSYLLINFWHTRILANKAAIKAMIINRIADVFFIFAILLILVHFKTLDYLIVFDLIHLLNEKRVFFFGIYFNLLNLICFFLFLGAIGKSAQIGLHVWLPDAMEGPTPVSALLHAATMVTAGVFLIVRNCVIFEYCDFILFLLIIFGGLTSLFFAIVAVFQYDIKKIIAYSTCSQLGLMFVACGLSLYQVAIFHLFNHAFFKALLFLGAGSLIHAAMDEQDIRFMGFFAKTLPLTYVSFMIGSLSIIGFPFLTGFYSKDMILELSFNCYILDGYFIYFMLITSAFFTTIYSLKLVFFVFFANNGFKHIIYAKENNIYMLFPLVCLGLLSIFCGYIFSDIFIGNGTYFWNNTIFTKNKISYIELEFISPLIKNLPFIFFVFGFISSVFFIKIISNMKLNFSSKNLIFLNILKKLQFFFFNAGFFNFFYNEIFVFSYKKSYAIPAKLVDKGYLEYFGPYGLYKAFRLCSYSLRKYTPSFIFLSIFLFLFFVILILTFMIMHVNILVALNQNFDLVLFLIFLFVIKEV
jgi:NADH-quinone oxidoreductase subunit L